MLELIVKVQKQYQKKYPLLTDTFIILLDMRKSFLFLHLKF